MSSALKRLVEEAASRIRRYSPADALRASQHGAVIVDIRSQDALERGGVVPGSLHIPRTVLEWRVALDSPWRNPHIASLDQQLILMCDHGYSSILAASNLVQIGCVGAGDITGGFEAWRDGGLPVTPWRPRASSGNELPGMAPPQ